MPGKRSKKRSVKRNNVNSDVKEYIKFKKDSKIKKNPKINFSQFQDSFKLLTKKVKSLSEKDLEIIEKEVQNSLESKNISDKLIDIYEKIVLYTDDKTSGGITSIIENIKNCKNINTTFRILKSEEEETGPDDAEYATCWDKYKLVKKLNSGMYGTTYLVKHNNNNKAIKIQNINIGKSWSMKTICNELSELLKEVFLLEKASNIKVSPKIYDKYMCFHKKSETLSFYIVMEYIDGVTLQDFLKKKPVLSKKDKSTLLNMVKKLHKENIIHNDLHSGNIMVTKNHKFYIIDFGISKEIADFKMDEEDIFEERLSKNFKWDFSNIDNNQKLALKIMIDMIY